LLYEKRILCLIDIRGFKRKILESISDEKENIKRTNEIMNLLKYLRKEFDENGINEIESVLLELQHFIFRLMHIFDHFGKGDTFLKGLSH